METPTAQNPMLPPQQSQTAAQPSRQSQSVDLRPDPEQRIVDGLEHFANALEQGGRPGPGDVGQAACESGYAALWEYGEAPGIAGGSERTATLKLGGMDVLVQQAVSGFCSVTLSQENRDFCANRTFEEIVEVAPIYELAILARVVARLRRIIYGGLIDVEPMRDAEAPDPAVVEVDGYDPSIPDEPDDGHLDPSDPM